MKAGCEESLGVRRAGAGVWVFAGSGEFASEGSRGAAWASASSGEGWTAGFVRAWARAGDAGGFAGGVGGPADYAAALSAAGAEDCGEAGGADYFVLDVAVAETGAVCGGCFGAFCFGI